MTSNDVRALLHELAGLARARPPSTSSTFAFVADFEPTFAFPDLPFDSSEREARYPDEARGGVRAVLDDAARLLAARAPGALAFVDAHLDRALVCRSPTVAEASSSSNRSHVGVCVLTNIEIAGDATLVCSEALVHETIHQYLYRIERSHGAFCDLDGTRRFRSPWSGNRIPLHSFVHACFVYFGLLQTWSALARGSRHNAAAIRDRIGQHLFGFRFVAQVVDDPRFPRDAVDPSVVRALDRMTRAADAAGLEVGGGRSVGEALEASADDAWRSRLEASLGLAERA